MCTMLLCQQVETGGGEEVAEILDAREGGGESSGSEAELLLVVGIDQPQLPVDDAEMAGAECFLKPFDGCPAAFDVEQLVRRWYPRSLWPSGAGWLYKACWAADE